MSYLISLDHVSLAFGLDALLDNVKLQVAGGERVCLIGRNGAGKSSLLKIVEGTCQPDSGTVWRQPGLRLSCLSQALPSDREMTVYEYVAQGLASTGQLLAAYHALTQKIALSHTERDLAELEQLQHRIDVNQGWAFEQNINTTLSRLELNADQKMADLSGGWQRRAALARALVSAPDLLLLDEPTNHLDIHAIQWLEELLLSSSVTLLFVTHDRTLLHRLATRIIELDRGQLTSWPGDYDNFLRRKEEMLHAEAKQNVEFDKKLAQEERWIRQGIKARRTRNEGRVRALYAMRTERAKRREVQGASSFNMNTAEQSGQVVIEAKNISHHFNHTPVIHNFSLRIMRGDKIGLIGPNGAGKSTLLNILLGELTPQQGSVTHGTKLHIAYFDQLRRNLDLEKSVIDNVAEGREFIEINGNRRHIISYLGDFLFTPQRALTPVKALSGGECNRLLLARLFSQPANLLVMDEPTNDLDIETLELLEELLSEYQGTLLLVSHDRTFLDNVVTSTLVFEGNGKVREYIGGYQDWLRQRKTEPAPMLQPARQPAQAIHQKISKQNKKLSYKEQRELDKLPAKIEALEHQQNELQIEVSSPEFYKKSPDVVTETLAKLKKISTDLEQAYQRWQELEDRSS